MEGWWLIRGLKLYERKKIQDFGFVLVKKKTLYKYFFHHLTI